MRPRAWRSSISRGSIPRSPGKLSPRKERMCSGVICDMSDMRGATLALGVQAKSLEAVVAEGLVALPHRLAEAGLGGAADEGVALLGMAGDAVEEGPQHLGLGKSL